MELKTTDIEISRLQSNSNQIDGLPRNPRKISKQMLEKLKKSLQDAPEMLRLRELIAVEHNGSFVVIAGNQRLQAAKELGFEMLPVKVLPPNTPVEKLREYAIKDNLPFGDDDWEILSGEWDVEELESWGMSIPEEWTEPELDELDDTQKEKKDYVVKITFKDNIALEEFIMKYRPLIQDDFNCVVSVSGGML